MGASNTESVKDMVNRIEIYDNSDNLIKTVGNTEYQKLYGVMQDVIRSSDTDEAVTEAQKRLKDQGYSQKMTGENLGDLRCITGNPVAVRESNTGICGLFWIQSDIHTWKNGLYLNKLTVSFDRIMDEQEAGSLPSAASSSSNGGEESSDKSGKLKSLGYYNKQGWQ